MSGNKSSQQGSIMKRVKNIMEEVQSKEHEELDFEKIEPFDDECKFGKNGLWLFIGPQGSGKTHKLIETILYTELCYDKPYYDSIIFSSTSESLDKTLDSFKKKIKTRIEFCPEDKLLDRLAMHIKRKAKFYSMMKYVKSHGTVSDTSMVKMAKKHKLYDVKKTSRYIKKKIDDYGHPSYPAPLLLILDNFLGSNLLENKMSEMVKMLTKCRHYNITCIISQQSTKGIGRTVRRLASDCCLWRGYGETDFYDLTKEFNLSMNRKDLFSIYQSFKSKHDHMDIHSHLDEVDIELNTADENK